MKVRGVEIPAEAVAKTERMFKQNMVRAHQVEGILRAEGFENPMRGADRILQSLKAKKQIKFNRAAHAWEWIGAQP